MFPYFPLYDQVHRALADPIVTRNSRLRRPSFGIPLSYGDNFSVGQLRHSIVCATGNSLGMKVHAVALAARLSALCDHIRRIIGTCPLVQMRGIYAVSNIARMKNKEITPFGIMEKIGKTVCPANSMFSNTHGPIPILVGLICPSPAIAPRAKPNCFVNFAPESFNMLVGKYWRDYIRFSHCLNHLSELIRAAANAFNIPAARLDYNTGLL